MDSSARSGNNKSYRDQSQHSGTSVPSAMRHVYSRVRLFAERDAVYQQPQPRRTTKPVRSNFYLPWYTASKPQAHITAAQQILEKLRTQSSQARSMKQQTKRSTRK